MQQKSSDFLEASAFHERDISNNAKDEETILLVAFPIVTITTFNR